MANEHPLSFTAKASRLLALLGWITLIVTLAVVVSIALPLFMTEEHDLYNLDNGVILLVIVPGLLLALAGFYLWVARSLRNHRKWARNTAIILAVLSLPSVPIGTLIGLALLYYLYKGRNEPAPATVTQTPPTSGTR